MFTKRFAVSTPQRKLPIKPRAPFASMGLGKGGRGHCSPWILKTLEKKVVFLISSSKKQILPLLPP